MLSNILKNIMVKAVRIRMENGEELEKILESYPRITKEEREEILAEIRNF